MEMSDFLKRTTKEHKNSPSKLISIVNQLP